MKTQKQLKFIVNEALASYTLQAIQYYNYSSTMAKSKSNSSKPKRNPNKATPPRGKARTLPKTTKVTPPPPLKQTSISFDKDKRASNQSDPIALMDCESSNRSTEDSNFLSPINSTTGSDDEADNEDAVGLLPPLGIETFMDIMKDNSTDAAGHQGWKAH